jgi:hypothetical protein
MEQVVPKPEHTETRLELVYKDVEEPQEMMQ